VQHSLGRCESDKNKTLEEKNCAPLRPLLRSRIFRIAAPKLVRIYQLIKDKAVPTNGR
jgi:hypothetical protein